MNDRQRTDFDLDQLLHPAQAFGHPSEVGNDPDLTLNETRDPRLLGIRRLRRRSRARAAQKPGRTSDSVR